MPAVYFVLLTFWGTSSVIKFTNWMYLFPMNKSESCLPSRTIRSKLATATVNYRVAQNTQMIHKTSGHFVLHAFALNSSNSSIHRFNSKQSLSKVYVTKRYTVIHRVFKFLFLFLPKEFGEHWATYQRSGTLFLAIFTSLVLIYGDCGTPGRRDFFVLITDWFILFFVKWRHQWHKWHFV